MERNILIQRFKMPIISDLPEGCDISADNMIDSHTSEHSVINDFYKDSVLFVTGSTGFIGKLIVEKLLYTCPNIKRLYVLVRPKKGKDIQQRFNEQFEGPVFERLKRKGIQKSKFEEKVHCMAGDCAEPNLGLSAADIETLQRDVNVVFHAAATVRFDENLRTATHINVRGARDLLTIAHDMKNLKAYVHVSTAFSHCPLKKIEEKFYDPPITSDNLIRLVDTLNNDMLEVITPILIGKWPNTYVFTKAVAEEVIQSYSKGLPIVMFRPSIVISTAKEPIGGWINNLYGPTGIVMGAALGLLKTLHCEPDFVADLVPADYVVNAIIASAWDVAKSRDANTININQKDITSSTNDVAIYNFVSSSQRPLTWRQFMEYNKVAGEDIPSPLSIWHYFFFLHSNRYIHLLFVYLFHFLPAIIVDTGALIIGRKPQLVQSYKKVSKYSDVISYFSTKEWNFDDNNIRALNSRLTEADKKIFYFDIKLLKWAEFIDTYLRGMRVYLANDPMDTVEQGKRKRTILFFAHYSLICIVVYGLIVFFYWLLF